MGCPCQAKQTIKATEQVFANPATVDCRFTKEQAAAWLLRVKCIKENAHYIALNIELYTINTYIGVLTSVGNYSGSPCYFEEKLNEIENFITIITANDLCLTV